MKQKQNINNTCDLLLMEYLSLLIDMIKVNERKSPNFQETFKLIQENCNILKCFAALLN